ncbi:hypothetical protein FAGKG844_330003 [Frankia sp. AgKG'84/4]
MDDGRRQINPSLRCVSYVTPTPEWFVVMF